MLTRWRYDSIETHGLGWSVLTGAWRVLANYSHHQRRDRWVMSTLTDTYSDNPMTGLTTDIRYATHGHI